DNQVGWAKHFASWGFVVVAPSFPNPFSPDAKVDAGIIAALVAMYAAPPAGSPAFGKVDGARIGLEGHSAGGLASALAAGDVKAGALVLFDPVDSGDAGKAALATLCTPILGIFAGASSCNDDAGWSAFREASAGPATVLDVVGATHCDGEN